MQVTVFWGIGIARMEFGIGNLEFVCLELVNESTQNSTLMWM